MFSWQIILSPSTNIVKSIAFHWELNCHLSYQTRKSKKQTTNHHFDAICHAFLFSTRHTTATKLPLKHKWSTHKLVWLPATVKHTIKRTNSITQQCKIDDSWATTTAKIEMRCRKCAKYQNRFTLITLQLQQNKAHSLWHTEFRCKFADKEVFPWRCAW